MEKIKQNPIVKKVGFNRIVLCCVLVLMYILFSVTAKGFAGLPRILSALNYVYFLGFLSLGVTFVIATGGIDFSIGPVMFCAALISGYCLTSYGLPTALCLVISILVGFLFGCFNGYLVAYWTVPPFIVSMASMNIAKGLASVFTKTQSVSWPQAADAAGWCLCGRAGPRETVRRGPCGRGRGWWHTRGARQWLWVCCHPRARWCGVAGL